MEAAWIKIIWRQLHRSKKRMLTNNTSHYYSSTTQTKSLALDLQN